MFIARLLYYRGTKISAICLESKLLASKFSTSSWFNLEIVKLFERIILIACSFILVLKELIILQMNKANLFFLLALLSVSYSQTNYYAPDIECGEKCSPNDSGVTCSSNIDKIKEFKKVLDGKITQNLLEDVPEHDLEKKEFKELNDMVNMGYDSFTKANTEFCKICCKIDPKKICLFDWELNSYNDCFYNSLLAKDSEEETLSYLKSLVEYQNYLKKKLESESINITISSSAENTKAEVKGNTLTDEQKNYILSLRPKFQTKKIRFRLKRFSHQKRLRKH